MDIKRNIIVITKKSTNYALFTIACKAERTITEQELKDAVISFYKHIGDNVDVTLVPIIGHFTDIKVVGNCIDTMLSWSLMSNVIL